MVDPRVKEAARILVEYSTKVKPGEIVQINLQAPEGAPLLKEIYKLVVQRGAYPVVHAGIPGLSYIYYKYASNKQLNKFPELAWNEIQKTDVYISIGADYNTRELTSIDPKKMALRQRVSEKISKWRVEKTRWVIYDYPTNALAQDAGMSLEEYEDFVFGATNINWEKQAARLKKIASIVDKTKKVRIVGEGTDLTFNIAGRHCMPGLGNFNMPDSEVWTTPIMNSANGHIKYTFPAIYGGNEVEGVYLEFRNGKVVKAKAEKNEKFLKAMIATDPGGSYIGEFGIGCNFAIDKFTKNILFDEKIGGTIHLALGNAYKENKGKSKEPINKSALHWDMIKDLRKGGALYFDGKLVQKNGKFLI